jgi:hypothetical protein
MVPVLLKARKFQFLVQDAIEDNCLDAQSYLRRRPFGVAISAPARMAMAVGIAPESPPGASAKARGCLVPRPGTPSSLLMVTTPRRNDGIVWSRQPIALRASITSHTINLQVSERWWLLEAGPSLAMGKAAYREANLDRERRSHAGGTAF